MDILRLSLFQGALGTLFVTVAHRYNSRDRFVIIDLCWQQLIQEMFAGIDVNDLS
jgi:hypothetical protein